MAGTLERGGMGPMKNGDFITLGQQGAQNQLLVEQWVYAMRILNITGDTRNKTLTHYHSFFTGTQHSHHEMTWNGVPRDPGVGYMWERLNPQGFVPVNSSMWLDAPYRKPDAALPLAKQIVSRFTEILLGSGRAPSLRVFSDEATEDYLEAAFAESDMWDVLSEARDMAGACGSAAIALGVVNGHLNAEVLAPMNLWIPQWSAGYPGWAPDYVVEQYKVDKQTIDQETGQLKMTAFWRTRAWTPTEIIYYEDVPVQDMADQANGEEVIPVREKVEHGLGACPVVWYQNTRCTANPDGRPDCDTAYELLDKLDQLQSQVYKAAIANADPTLVIKENRANRTRDNRLIQKGSRGVIGLSEKGDADYLEMSGTSVKVGLDAIDKLIHEILHTVECVIITPEHARAYQSGEALQLLWRSMEARASRLRVTLGATIKEICYFFLKMAEVHGVANMEKVGTRDETRGILLPPRKMPTVPSEVLQKVPEGATDAGPAMLAPAPNEVYGPHTPGNANAFVHLEWPPFWSPTPQQVQSMAQALSTSTTASQFLSKESATRKMSQFLDLDGDEEVRRMNEEEQNGMDRMMNLGAIQNQLDEEDGDSPFGEDESIEVEDRTEDEDLEDDDLDDEDVDLPS